MLSLIKGSSFLYYPIDQLSNYPTPVGILYLGYILPYAISYLVHIPNTRLLRIALYPFGLICMIWVIVSIPGDRGKQAAARLG